MPTSTPKYLSLPRLTEEWAVQSGEPIGLVLRRICDWAICDGFPAGTFIERNGGQLETIDLYMSCAVEFTEARPTNCNVRWGRDLLERTLVKTEGILAFCENTGTVPTPSLDSAISKLKRAFSSPLNASPPPCAAARMRADQILQKQSAVGFINTLKSMLTTARGKETSSGLAHHPLISDEARARWENYLGMAEQDAENCCELSLRSEIDELRKQWEAVASDSDCQSKKRLRGRPPGSGSLVNADLTIIRRMHDEIIKTGASISSAAAKFIDKAPGAGTDESKLSRLRKRYSERYPDA